jgi:protein-L-isoaspartate(D-aspartate) O-methyltransferase
MAVTIQVLLVNPAVWSGEVVNNASLAWFERARREMVEEQLSAPGRDIRDPKVLQAMGAVPRHEFVPEALRRSAYLDQPLPIGYGQTISQPYIVAFMTEQLHPKETDRVLEIGTGSGYQAAVLSKLVAEVYTMEIVEPLARRAEADLKRLGFANVTVRAGDGYAGWRQAAPFDAIIVTCAPDHIPQPLIDQLKEGGRMIIPVGRSENQSLYRLTKRGGKVERRAVLPVRFVPMTGEQAGRTNSTQARTKPSPAAVHRE